MSTYYRVRQVVVDLRSRFQWASISFLTSISVFAECQKENSAKRLPNPRSVGLRFGFLVMKKEISYE